MNLTLYFITGVSGAGKSAVIPHLKRALSNDKFQIYDFDIRGVPDGGGIDWRIAETQYWIDTAVLNAKKGLSTIVCGFANPEEKSHLTIEDTIAIQYILLDASENTIRKRLLGRYADPKTIPEIERASGRSLESFIQKNAEGALFIRQTCQQYECTIIETGESTIEEVASRIIEYLGGRN